ncbi:MAG: UDP-glucose/GDP-mannose dehydrogenase family protein [Halobacteriovoraceae bacterium]|nr:UDP-glucose/GDP-mannose dehydrogenase family protein [Halobacteriovoraceae bacterium]
MKVTVIGTGYVGLVSGTCFAEIGHQVTCVDIDPAKIKMLEEGLCPIYEPGLTDILHRGTKSGRLKFSTSYESVGQAKAIFLAVGTPSLPDGQANLEYLNSAAVSVAKELSQGAVVVIKSTVPVGTSTKLRQLIAENTKEEFYLVNNPEFLKEGTAVEDFMRPDRVIIGYKEKAAADVMDELYSSLLRQGNPLYKMSNLSAEMSKYAANCFLATKISFINEVAKLCDSVGADIEEVRNGISSDKRIGGHFLYPGPGYGGSCFPKDVQALVFTAKENEQDFKIVRATEEVNNEQKTYMFQKMLKHFDGDLKGKKFAFWGVAFKANTDDVREAPAIYMARALVEAGATVNYFDPVAAENYSKTMKSFPETDGKLNSFPNKYDCLDNCDGLVTMTEWREFRNPDLKLVKEKLGKAVIFDARNLYDTQKVLCSGFDYYAIGKHVEQN